LEGVEDKDKEDICGCSDMAKLDETKKQVKKTDEQPKEEAGEGVGKTITTVPKARRAR